MLSLDNQQHSKVCSSKDLIVLAFGALGIVYGDIGTSPLYALKETFNPSNGIPLTPENIIGILSIVFWSLTLIVAFKYLSFIFKADNNGEGGVMAMLALLIPKVRTNDVARQRNIIILLGIFGAGLLAGDGVITPAISVLGALEGLGVATPAFKPAIIPLTIAVLLALFNFQKRGTGKMAFVFGPVMLVWFIVIAAIGVPWIFKQPEVLSALNPLYAAKYFGTYGLRGITVLGSVILCVTGAEALYADMGHFGKAPIRLGWYSMVFPALTIHYFGQGALILEQGASAVANPFFSLVSGWFVYPLVAIATLAAIVASQALISGMFSLIQQAVQLGYLPRTTILHTSRRTEGQIYLPKVNLMLAIGCIMLVLIFENTTRLATAYGVAAVGTMVISTLLFFSVTRRIWKWPLIKSVPIVTVFLIVDLAFLFGNLGKIVRGGWIPLSIAAGVMIVMTTWKRGRDYLARVVLGSSIPLSEFIEEVERKKIPRVQGAAVFMTLARDIAPSVLLHHYRHNRSLHEKVLLLSVITENVPDVSALERVRVTELQGGFFKVVARYGYMEQPDVAEVFQLAGGAGLVLDVNSVSYYLGRETFLSTGNSGMNRWRKKLFVLLSKNARSAAEFFNLPPDRVIEIGSQIRI